MTPSPLVDAWHAAGLTVVERAGLPVVLELAGSVGEEARRARAAVGLIARPRQGLVDFTGAAVGEFLEKIVSCHVEDLAPGAVRPGCLLGAKGRLLGGFWISRRQDEANSERWRARFLDPPLPAALDSFRKYAFLGDIEVSPRLDMELFTVVGPRAAEVVARVAGAAPELAASVAARVAGVEIVVAGGPGGRFEIEVPGAAAVAVRDELLEVVRSLGGDAIGWDAEESLRIEAGVPRQGADHDEESFPGEVGWDLALTFDKCYVGQEIVARQRTYGHVNRKLFGLRFDAAAASELRPGATLHDGSSEAGHLTSVAAEVADGAVQALALVRRKHFDVESLSTAGGAVGRLRSLAPFL